MEIVTINCYVGYYEDTVRPQKGFLKAIRMQLERYTPDPNKICDEYLLHVRHPLDGELRKARYFQRSMTLEGNEVFQDLEDWIYQEVIFLYEGYDVVRNFAVVFAPKQALERLVGY